MSLCTEGIEGNETCRIKCLSLAKIILLGGNDFVLPITITQSSWNIDRVDAERRVHGEQSYQCSGTDKNRHFIFAL